MALRPTTVLYVTTQLMGARRYFSWSSYPDIRYARLQQKVIEVLSAAQGIKAFVKFYPNDFTPNPNKTIENQPGNPVTVLTDSLLSILTNQYFDLIVTEACATTLLEILCTTSTLLCFFPGDFIKIKPQNRRILNKRVHLPETEQDYLSLLSRLMKADPTVETKALNDDFLFTFGIEPGNNSPTMQANKAIETILS